MKKGTLLSILGLSIVMSVNCFATVIKCPAKEICDECKSQCVNEDGTPTDTCPEECGPCKNCPSQDE